MMVVARVRFVVLSALVFGACAPGGSDGAKIASQSAALTAEENTERALKGVLDSGGFLAESQSVAETMSAIAGSSESCSGTYVTPVCPAGTPDCDTTPIYEEECVSEPNELTTADLVDARQELYDAVDALLTEMRERIFVPTNVESEDGTQVTYLLGAELLCPETDEVLPPSQGDPVAPEPAVDEQCAMDVAKLQPRLRLTAPAEGDIDVQLLLTEQRRNPVTLQLYEDRLGLVVDLGELKATFDAVNQPLEGVSALSGQVGLELVKNAELDYSVRFNVLEDVNVVAGDAGEEAAITLARSVPSAEARFDGNQRTITATYNYGAFNLVAPLSSFFSDDEENYDDSGNSIAPRTYTGMVDLLVGGLNGTLTLDGNRDVLSFTDIGLGDVPTTVHLEDDLLFQLDVNAGHDRRFDVSVESDAQEDALFTFSPTLDISALLAFQHLSDQVPDLEPFLMNDTVHLFFDEAEPTIVPEENQIRVVSGTMHLTSQAAPESSLEVAAGMCLLENTGAAPDSAPSLPAAFMAGACAD